MSQGVIYSSQFRFYVERVLRAHRNLGYAGQISEVELIETYLRQQGVTVVDDVTPADLDTVSPLG